MSFFRRYVSGVYPLLVWAEDDEAADVTAAIHGASLPPFPVLIFLDPSRFELRPPDDEV